MRLSFERETVSSGVKSVDPPCGAIPQRAALTNYLNDIVNTDRSKLKKKLADKQLQLFVDETFDKEGRYVCSFLIAMVPPSEIRHKILLVSTAFLNEPLDLSKVANLILNLCSDYSIDFNTILGISTDNAAYRKASWNHCLETVFKNGFRLTCIAHILNLILRLLGSF